MDEEETALSKAIYTAMMRHSGEDARSAQAAAWQVGISDLGYCSTRLLRMLRKEDPGPTDLLTAFIGTAIGDHVEQAIKRYAFPEAILQAEVHLTLDSGSQQFVIPGHPDVILPDKLLDGKTALGLSLVERGGRGVADVQRRFQRHLYAKAVAADPRYGFAVPLEEVQVGNYYIDRSGEDKYVHVSLEPYDEAVVDEATAWLEEVVYAFIHEADAPKEPPREVCAQTCGFFSVCRMYDTDTVGLLTDEAVLGAIAQYDAGRDLASEGERLKRQAKAVLDGVEGFANVDGQRFALRWTHVNETLIKEHRRAAQDKIELKKVT